MNTLMKRLPLLALVLAAFAAVAFTSPMAPEYAQDPVTPSIWYDLTEVDPGPNTYDCNGEEIICTRNQAGTHGNMVKEGQFEKLGPLPVYNP
jgi:hypothetical protein